ncbi:MAG TPA: host attachment protein [Micropepsaceae bacterium]|nr:host attachment protein [Micropepsaceae bacterium]
MPITPPEDVLLDGPEGEMSRAWYRFRSGHGFLRGPKAQFAGHIAQILQEAAAEQAYDGLIIIAAPYIADELERALDPRTRALLVGDVVRDLPMSESPKPLVCAGF